MCDLEAFDNQEEDKVIEDILMRISTNCIIVEDSFNEVEEVEKEALTVEHNEDVFNIDSEYASV